jgi:hypothetical protein
VQIANRGRATTKAYNDHLRGRFFWGKRTEAGFRMAIEYFNRAIEEDPAYAADYTGRRLLPFAWRIRLTSNCRRFPQGAKRRGPSARSLSEID